MTLRSWNSNSPDFLRTLLPDDIDQRTVLKVLGLIWRRDVDTLIGVVLDCHQLLLVGTKREVLHGVAATYDPLGLYSPITIHGKLLLQQLWQAKCGWDDVLSADILVEWSTIVEDLNCISTTPLPRYIGSFGLVDATHQLMCFCDALSKAYAAVVYLHSTSLRGHQRTKTCTEFEHWQRHHNSPLLSLRRECC